MRGGATSRNCGFGEISGKQTLHFAGKVDARAPHGTIGKVVMDPTDATIQGEIAADTTIFATNNVDINGDVTIDSAATLKLLADHNSDTPGDWEDGVGAITRSGAFTVSGADNTSHLTMWAAGGGIGMN